MQSSGYSEKLWLSFPFLKTFLWNLKELLKTADSRNEKEKREETGSETVQFSPFFKNKFYSVKQKPTDSEKQS